MSLLNYLNFGSTVLAFGCVSFAASNFGVKLGRATGFSNRSGYEYVSKEAKSKELYADIAKVAEKEEGAPKWAKNANTLEIWCRARQGKIRNWNDASKYCLVRNNVRHQLIKAGYTLEDKSEATSTNTSSTGTGGVAATGVAVEKPNCEDVWNSYADEKHDSVWYLYGKIHCVKSPETAQPATASAGSVPSGT